MSDAVFTHRFSSSERGAGTGARIGVKDLIDMVGTITTAGCRAIADNASVARHDAPCLSGIRAAEQDGRVQIVGKTNLHELAFGADGINEAFGTPLNPVDSFRVPGGSSSGSSVAVATNEVDIALGSDTGGSIRIPAACCRIVGLKTTWGRISTSGVWPLAPSLDTIGPMGRTGSDCVKGMDLLEPGFALEFANQPRTKTIGRIRLRSNDTDPIIDNAIDSALLACGAIVVDITIPFWEDVHDAGITVLLREAWKTDGHLLAPKNLGVSAITEARLQLGNRVSDEQLHQALLVRAHTKAAIAEIFSRFDVLAIPTLPIFTPLLSESNGAPLTALTRFANLTGLPAASVPVRLSAQHKNHKLAHLGSSIQLIGPDRGEAAVLRAAELFENHQ
jgi:amidase